MGTHHARITHQLPQLGDKGFITDGGLETTLVFHKRMDLPCFAAFTLLETKHGRQTLEEYFEQYIELAKNHKAGIILETVTWRANRDWGARLGYSEEQLHEVNTRAAKHLLELRARHQSAATPIVISGNIGPRGDGYAPDQKMTATEARLYHSPQIEALARSGVDMLCAMTINYVDEAIGIVQAAQQTGMGVCISFTLETDGRLPTGMSLKQAIETVDASTDGYPLYYMVNCAHPSHFDHVLGAGEAWTDRIFAVRCNASKRSHAELDEATELDEGDPQELSMNIAGLKQKLKNLRIFGGCCGTDHRHIEQMCTTCL